MFEKSLSPDAALWDDGCMNRQEAWTLVLNGLFNPFIFRAGWCAKVGILPSEHAEQVKTEIEAPELVTWTTGSLALTVRPNQFSITVTNTPPEEVMCFAVACFDRLRHTPLHSMLVSRHIHGARQAGDGRPNRLSNLFDAALSGAGQQAGGPALRPNSLVFDVDLPIGSQPGKTALIVEPSVRIPEGVFLQLSRSHMLVEGQVLIDAEEALPIMGTVWVETVAAFDDIAAWGFDS